MSKTIGPETIDKVYDPQAVEAKWYAFWEEHGLFHAEVDRSRPAFCITIPPPNVTGELHMGHAIQHAIHDALIRWRRMQGYVTLCLPGTDHAGIATQMKVEEELTRTEGKTRYDLGREAMLERIWAWRAKYGDAIYDQLRKLGCSYDWQRARFTLDEGYAAAVLAAFQRYQERGWIYRGTRMINWCPSCGTVISDLETEEREQQGHLWHLRYPGRDGGPDVVVATTRPETMLGDTAVAVHPRDPRWQDALGRQVLLPLMEREIPIVADEYADPEMGSGAVKVTPAHDPNDYEVGQRHGLAQVQVIDFDGRMTQAAGRYAGMDRYACRAAVVADLEAAGLLVKVEDHLHAIPHHDKCGTVIEPLPMEQWFMDMQELGRQTLPILERAEIEYVPDRFRGYAVEWLQGIRDWALSRQIWWGHRIPAWYCVRCSADGLLPMGGLTLARALADGSFRVSVERGARPIVSVERPTVCPDCGSTELVQDPDVLDTWFSSALWPFATLGWPEPTEELEYFYPTDLMITARDILYLWVLRMAMTSVECLGRIPFRTVLVHPTVLTKDGRRMSKSLGTGLNPLDLVRLYGADATRFSLLHQVGTVQDVRFDAEIENNAVTACSSAETARNFSNKVWNAARFVLMNLEDYRPGESPAGSDELADRWIRSRLAVVIGAVDQHLAGYRFSEVIRALYDFLWRDYCDWYVELAKARLHGGDAVARGQAQHQLVTVLEQALRLLHPAMPYLTETLWQALPLMPERKTVSIMVAPWPKADPDWADAEAEAEMELIQAVVTAVRTIRSEMNVPPAKQVRVLVSAPSATAVARLSQASDYLRFLARAEAVEIGEGLAQPPASGSAVVGELQVFVPLEGLIDLEVEQRRLEKEVAKFDKLVRGMEGKLGNPAFLDKAPPEVVARERDKEREYRASLAQLRESLTRLGR
ncbi:MAG: valine--tRNA ligase [Candidatus Latescibacterota bacterium]|jgi:valyl-tRNA synthetase